MKFKQSDGQNQRIERITTSHLVVGIDMAKETHVAQATNYRGIVLASRHLSFSNTIEGFEKLERWMKGLQQKHRLNSMIIGMENDSSTSNIYYFRESANIYSYQLTPESNVDHKIDARIMAYMG